MNIVVRGLRNKEITEASEIVREIWGDGPADKVIDEMAEMFGPSAFPPYYFVAVLDKKIIGFTGLRPCLIFPHTFECIWINVKPQYQGLGIGRLLNEARLKKIKELHGKLTFVMTKNLKFFGAFGFKPIREYDDGWCLMELKTGETKLS